VQRYYTFRVAVLVTDMFIALKEVTLRNKTGEVSDVVHRNRLHTTRSRANLSFLGAVPKFVVESALVGGFLLIGGLAFLMGGPGEAFSAIALFGVAGFRMIPSLITFQGIVSSATATLPQVDMIIDDIELTRGYVERTEQLGQDPLPADPKVLSLRDVDFRYEPDAAPALRGVNLEIPFGSSVALVGHSGAGKSTLVDMLLGLLEPTEGTLDIDGKPLSDVLAAWRERVGYVPQEVILFDGTIAQNVALTWESNFDEDRVREALRRAQLLDVIEARPGGIHAGIGERGLALSGGQRQRMGIARALYSDPLVLVLDEATSALDTETESRVTRAIAELKGNVTLISVAHRLSTIRDSDQICFMADGEIVQSGRFDDLVRGVPDFAVQAKLAGLSWDDSDGGGFAAKEKEAE
jgi:ATP-binding cassette subfamily C protein